jgi:hypothetical protein
MKLPVIQRFQKQNYPGSPDWFTRFLGDINSFTETIWNALNRNLTISDNIDAQVYTFTLTAGAGASNNTTTFQTTLKHTPQAVFVGNVLNTTAYAAAPTAAVWASWSFTNPQIAINAITGLTSGQSYQITLVVL